jgi:hypothetical protein
MTTVIEVPEQRHHFNGTAPTPPAAEPVPTQAHLSLRVWGVATPLGRLQFELYELADELWPVVEELDRRTALKRERDRGYRQHREEVAL